MASLVSTWSSNVHSLPENYIMPPERRPGTFAPICKDIPVIDLGSELGHSRAYLVQQIIKASQEIGMFQVINHGVPEDLMNDTMNLYKEFFDMPIKDKERVFSDDSCQSTRLYTSGLHFAKEEVHYWKDTLKHPVHPVEDYKHTWPEKPTRYRDVIETYATETRKLGLKILDLISEGLGLKEGYFEKELSKEQGMSVNHYPICPDPSLAMGIGSHCDPNLITILQQQAYGLQIFKDGQWVGVDPLPNAFVINLCYQMQIISNGKLKSTEHRAVTSSSSARTSIVTFISPSHDSVIEPAKALVNVCDPALFKTFLYKEFLENYMSYITKKPRVGTALGPYEIRG